MTRGDDDFHWGPTVPHQRSKLETVHGPRHFDISEYDRNGGLAFQHFDCFGRVGGLQNTEALALQVVNDVEKDERLILDNEDRHFFSHVRSDPLPWPPTRRSGERSVY